MKSAILPNSMKKSYWNTSKDAGAIADILYEFSLAHGLARWALNQRISCPGSESAPGSNLPAYAVPEQHIKRGHINLRDTRAGYVAREMY